jgi:UDP-N-acetylmuramoyl-tripeptide--D-alanyl-D-alanine ligase
VAVPAFFHLNFIQSALGVPPSRSGAVSFSAVATDSRKIKPGSLFVALKGERVDGHDYLDAAIQSGATGLIVQKGRSIKIPGTISNSVTVFEVPDTLAAFRTLAAAWRKDFPGPVIAVAGAVGKTSTKEMLAAIVAGRKGPQTVLKTEASQNGFIGIPMTLLELRPEHKIAVIEIGIDDIGAMRSHLDIVKPTAAIVTAIGPEHFEKLKDLDTVTREETLSLTDTLDRGGSAAINLDDPEIRKKMGRTTNTRALAYSMEGRRDLPHVIWGKMEGAKLVALRPT